MSEHQENQVELTPDSSPNSRLLLVSRILSALFLLFALSYVSIADYITAYAGRTYNGSEWGLIGGLFKPMETLFMSMPLFIYGLVSSITVLVNSGKNLALLKSFFTIDIIIFGLYIMYYIQEYIDELNPNNEYWTPENVAEAQFNAIAFSVLFCVVALLPIANLIIVRKLGKDSHQAKAHTVGAVVEDATPSQNKDS